MSTKDELFRALVENRLGELGRMLSNGADVNAVAVDSTTLAGPSSIAPGDTLLNVALYLENREAVELLLRFNPNLNISSQDGGTPFLIAVARGLADIALRFLQAGANFNALDKYGLAPLHYASDVELIEAIVQKGVSVDLVAHSTGWTPLHYAAYHNQVPKAKCLLRFGAYLEARGMHGETPLHLLMALPYREVTELGDILLTSGADINQRDDSGNTALHWALGSHHSDCWMDRGNSKAVKYLLSRNAKCDVKNKENLSPVAMAFRHPKKEFWIPFEEAGIRPTLPERLRGLC